MVLREGNVYVLQERLQWRLHAPPTAIVYDEIVWVEIGGKNMQHIKFWTTVDRKHDEKANIEFCTHQNGERMQDEEGNYLCQNPIENRDILETSIQTFQTVIEDQSGLQSLEDALSTLDHLQSDLLEAKNNLEEALAYLRRANDEDLETMDQEMQAYTEMKGDILF